MKALLLAGGRGTRLLPYTTTVPKPLFPIGDIPIMELLLRQLGRHGLREVFVATGYLGHLIETFFGDGEKLGLSLRYLREVNPLGTAGPIAAALPDLGADFLVLNGDLVTTLDFSEFQNFHKKLSADATVAVTTRRTTSQFGLIEQDAEGRLTNYREKPTETATVSMGCYVFRAAALEPRVRAGEYLDMPDLILRLRDAGANVRCHTQSCRWFDVGRPEDHKLANEWFAAHREEFLAPA